MRANSKEEGTMGTNWIESLVGEMGLFRKQMGLNDLGKGIKEGEFYTKGG